jgi:topoisomerase-4 subunit B
VSVVNALSTRVDVHIKRDGNEYRMTFAHGDRTSKLETVGSVGRKNTGTRLRFWPDPKYFDTPKVQPARAETPACAPRPCSAPA